MTTLNDYYIGIRMLANRTGVDVWDINQTKIDAYLQLEERPISRWLPTYAQRHLDGAGDGETGKC